MSILYYTSLACALMSGASPVSAAVDNNKQSAVSSAVAEVPAWVGSYAGTIPAANCPGIQVQLTLKEDGSFKMIEKALDRDFPPKVAEGQIEWVEKGKTFTVAHDGRDLAFEIDGDKVHMVNEDLSRVEGELAEYYILRKASK